MIAKDNPYIPVVLSLLPRVLTNLDRDSGSPTYGSFDRSHWHLKISNFSSAVLQQAVFILAACYKNDFEGNVYYDNPRIKQWALASLEYWAKIQNHDGSFDEYWKGEGSFPATAFSCFSSTEVYLLLGLNDPRLLAAMERAIKFLSGRTETFAVNQEVVSAASVYNMYLITKSKKFLELSEKKIAQLKTMQTSDGFFPEHDGADIGYSSVTLEYLSVLYEKTAREDIKEMCNALVEFLSYFVHPDGTSGGAYSSRGTEYFMLGGLESCSSFNPRCAPLRELLFDNMILKNHRGLGIDERYVLHYIGCSFTRGLLKYHRGLLDQGFLYREEVKKLFPKAKLYVVSQPPVYLIISLFKGGIFRLYENGNLLLEDTGYRIVKGKSIFHTEIGDDCHYEVAEGKVSITKNFYSKQYAVITPLRSFLLFCYSLVFGNALWVYFRRKFIKGARRTGIILKRDLLISSDSVIIEDRIDNAPKAKLIKNPAESIKNIPSAKFFQTQELEDKAPVISYDVHGSFCLKTVIDLKNREIKLFTH
jgi:hypothetical protein